MRATLETRLIESQASSLSFLETFSALLQDELDRRQSRLLERRYQLSGLEERASLAEFDWGYNPKIPKRTCFEPAYPEVHRRGRQRTADRSARHRKSHIAKAIAYSALRSGLRVLYGEAGMSCSPISLRARAPTSASCSSPSSTPTCWCSTTCSWPATPAEAADALQSILHKRYKLRRSSLITSKPHHRGLAQVSRRRRLTTAILDRLLHRSVLLEFRGKSYRLKEAASRLAKATHPE
ncbi:MAG: ATP-binding protein [Sterolibacteriaceae bacterium]|nr:ATP-binding protein [Sterolibacteriaceae bacterium]